MLIISPVLPSRLGHGLEQRAYRVVEALSHWYQVSFLTTARKEPTDLAVADARSLCDEVIVFPLSRWTAGALGRRVLRRFLAAEYYTRYRRPSDWTFLSRDEQKRLSRCLREQYDLVYVYRLYMIPLLQSCAALARVPRWIDLDDVESVTRSRLAEVARSNGDRRTAHLMQQDAEQYRIIEQEELARFDRVVVCSKTDRARLLKMHPALCVEALPNVVELPGAAPRVPRASNVQFVFLFVGTLDYYANRDAIAFFCHDVVPAIRERVTTQFEIRIVSKAARATKRFVPVIPELSWAPRDTDLAREYERADMVIVPMRAGGGTRIKVLEAFAHGVPVLSTDMGVEGLDVVHGEHALIGKTAAELGAQAASAMCDAALRVRLAKSAFGLVEEKYTPAALERRLGGILEESPCLT